MTKQSEASHPWFREITLLMLQKDSMAKILHWDIYSDLHEALVIVI